MSPPLRLSAPAATPVELGGILANRPTSYWEMLGAELGEGLFDRPLVGNTPPELLTQPEEWDWLLEQRLDYVRRQFGREPTPDEIEFQRGQIERGQRNQAQRWTPLEQDAWQGSAWFREGIPYEEGMTEERAAWLAERYDSTQFNQWVLANHEGVGFGISTASGFLARLVGNIPDPTNFIPFVSPAMRVAMVGRLGAIGGRATASSMDALIGASLAEPLVVQGRERIGEEVTFADAVLDVAISGLIGAAFGSGAGVLRSRADARIAARRESARAALTNLRVADEALTKTMIAIRQIEAGQPVEVPAVSRASTEDILVGLSIQERARLAEAVSAEGRAEFADLFRGRRFDATTPERFATPTAEEVAAVRGPTMRQRAIGRAAVDAETEQLARERAARELPPRERSEAFAAREEPLTPSEAPPLRRPDEGALVRPTERRLTTAPLTRLERMALYDPSPRLREAARMELDRDLSARRTSRRNPVPKSIEATPRIAEPAGPPRSGDPVADIDAKAEAERLQQAYGENGIDQNGEFPELAQWRAIDDLTPAERQAFDAAEADMAKTARASEAYDAAAVCLVG